MHVQSLQSYQILCDPMDCSLPGHPVHGISQTRILEQAAMPASRRSSRSGDQTRISCSSCISFPMDFFTCWAIRKALLLLCGSSNNVEDMYGGWDPKIWIVSDFSCCLLALNPHFYILLGDSGAGAIPTIFLLCQLALCYALLTENSRERL